MLEKPDRQILAGRALEEQHLLLCKPTPVADSFARILVGKLGLVKVRGAGQFAHTRLAHQILELHIGTGESAHDDGLHATNKGEEVFVGIDIDRQRQQVGEQAHEIFDFGRCAHAHRCADNQISIADKTPENHVVSRQQGNEEGRVHAPAECAHLRRNVSRDLDPFSLAQPDQGLAARLVGGQLLRRSELSQALTPAAKLALELPCVIATQQPLRMPLRELAITHRQRLKDRLAIFAVRRIELGELGIEKIERPAIPDDVMRHEEEHMLLSGQAEHVDAVERCTLEVDHDIGQFIEPGQQARLALGRIEA